MQSQLGKRKRINNSNDNNAENNNFTANKKKPTDLRITTNPSSRQHQASIVCAGDFSSCFTMCIGNDKRIYSFGYSKNKAHGHNNSDTFVAPKRIKKLTNIKMIDCNSDRSLCLDYDGNVFILGNNYNKKSSIEKCHDKVGDIYMLRNINLQRRLNIPPCKQVCCGGRFSFFLTEDNLLYSLGEDYIGRLGLGQVDKKDNQQYKFNIPKLIPDLYNVEYVTCGGYYSICKTYDNKFYSCGRGKSTGTTKDDDHESYKFTECLNWPDNIISVKCGYSHRLLLTSEGYVYSFGYNNHGELGLIDGIPKSSPTLIRDIPEIKRIECGAFHSLCIDINDCLWVFGSNEEGQLGLGDKQDRCTPVLHSTLSNIIDISSRGNHTFVKTQENKVYAFGNNSHSQLGTKKTKKHQTTPIQTLIGIEDKWCSTIGKSKQKSARK